VSHANIDYLTAHWQGENFSYLPPILIEHLIAMNTAVEQAFRHTYSGTVEHKTYKTSEPKPPRMRQTMRIDQTDERPRS
jgi:hypothetical protein